jgi:cellulose 1,4-beta-cellobiosidase
MGNVSLGDCCEVFVLIVSSGGGTGYSGSTACVSGYTCTYSNPYYSQCLPGSGAATTTAPTTTSAPTTTGAPTSTAAASGNPYSGVSLYSNPYYASEISTSAIPSLTGAQATAAAAVANVPAFFWM